MGTPYRFSMARDKKMAERNRQIKKFVKDYGHGGLTQASKKWNLSAMTIHNIVHNPLSHRTLED